MFTFLVPAAAAHADSVLHVHPESSPLPIVIVGAWALLALAWWARARAA